MVRIPAVGQADRLSFFFLLIVAAVFAVFGIIYLISPATFAGAAGLQANASGLTDIRATYGGFQLGFALFLLCAARSSIPLHAGLLGCVLVVACVALGRIVGVAVDGEFSGFHKVGLALEVCIVVVALWRYRAETR